VLLLSGQEDPALVAVRTRQEAVKTAFIKFKRTEFIAKQSIAEANGSGALFPPDDVTLESVNLLVLDGEKFRYEDHHPVFRPGGSWVRQDRVSACNGSVAATLLPRGPSGSASPAGTVYTGASNVAVLPFQLVPLGLTLRWLDPALNPYRRRLIRPTGDTLPLDGAPCRGYRLDVPVRLWLDPEKDYVARRVGTGAQQLDVSYRLVSGVWVPDSWAVSRLGLVGAALVTEKVEVLEVRLNEP
jgi:hypothetical protein